MKKRTLQFASFAAVVMLAITRQYCTILLWECFANLLSELFLAVMRMYWKACDWLACNRGISSKEFLSLKESPKRN